MSVNPEKHPASNRMTIPLTPQHVAAVDYAVVTIESENHDHLITHSVGLSRHAGFEYVCVHESMPDEYRHTVDYLCRCAIGGRTPHRVRLNRFYVWTEVERLDVHDVGIGDVDPLFIERLETLNIHLTGDCVVKLLTPVDALNENIDKDLRPQPMVIDPSHFY